MMNNNIRCPKCNSDNVQTEGVLHLCLDCGYKWEDAPQTDLGEMIIYQSDGGVKLDVRLENKTVWLNQDQIASLFNKSKSTIVEHISNIFKEGEFDEKVVVRKFRITTQHGAMAGKTQSKEVKSYNLDVIISVGYRVKSIQGTRFRQWATERLNESIVKGFTMDDERLKNLGGGNYWKELLDRTRYCHEKINKKKENIFLFSTDTSLKFIKAFEYYQVRWTVVMYREWQTGL